MRTTQSRLLVKSCKVNIQGCKLLEELRTYLLGLPGLGHPDCTFLLGSTSDIHLNNHQQYTYIYV
jgi:hypothetical protein